MVGLPPGGVILKLKQRVPGQPEAFKQLYPDFILVRSGTFADKHLDGFGAEWKLIYADTDFKLLGLGENLVAPAGGAQGSRAMWEPGF